MTICLYGRKLRLSGENEYDVLIAYSIRSYIEVGVERHALDTKQEGIFEDSTPIVPVNSGPRCAPELQDGNSFFIIFQSFGRIASKELSAEGVM